MPEGENNGTDWSKVDRALEKQNAGTRLPVEQGPGGVVDAPMVRPEGIVAEYKANKMRRRAALEAIDASYREQLDVLKHQLKQAAIVKKAEVDVMAEEFLKDLDARHLKALAEIGLRNKDTRERALIDATRQTAQKLKEIQALDCPEHLVNDTIERVISVHERIADEIMQEMGRQDDV